MQHIIPEDLLKFGLIPEFIGRLPVMAALEKLTTDDLVRILTEPKNALVKQYQKLLSLDDTELEFEPEALRAIAKKSNRTQHWCSRSSFYHRRNHDGCDV